MTGETMSRQLDSAQSPGPEHADDQTRANRAGARQDDDPTLQFAFLHPPVNEDEIGRLGGFRVLRLLGMGGMGIVFQAEDIALQRAVALKVLRPDLQREQGCDSMQRFLKEARAMASLKHDNLVTIYQVGQEGGVTYIASELLEGETLQRWIRRHDTLDVTEVCRIGREVALGLTALHSRGLIHRDIKPSNLWIEATSGRTKILDLGLVHDTKSSNGLTAAGMIVGTPAYLSPEQARGKPIDARSDLFSLGCVLYVMCSRQLPFDGENSLDQLASLAADEPPALRSHNPKVPAALAALIHDLLAKRPEDRPESAQIVADRLEPIRISRCGKPRKSQPELTAPMSVPSDAKIKKQNKARRRRKRSSGATAGWAFAAIFCLIASMGIVLPLTPWGGRQAPGASQDGFLSKLEKLEAVNWPMHHRPGAEGLPLPPGVGGPVMVRGEISPHGIFMHAAPPHDRPASITYRLEKRYDTFEAAVSLNDSCPTFPPTMVFEVFGDGKPLWQSKPIATQDDRQSCSVSVQNVNLLKIQVTSAGHPQGAHGVWIEPTLK